MLAVCRKHDLLHPTYYLEDDGTPVPFESEEVGKVIDSLREKVASEELRGEILRIGGYGLVCVDEGRTVVQKDLLTIDSIRLFEHNISVRAPINCWTPLSMDRDYAFHWQVKLARLNEARLERCLNDIYQSLGNSVEPDVDEVDAEQPVWMKGFRLYWNPEILRREYRKAPPAEPFDLDEYLISK
ncbi:hypothetical protein BE21_01830 [Sorangium cellulosum]|uniref:Uncharacterized protein n=1 Tax=Sorangium cellulosum TaxID=56 RepID=A0A150TW98_SORCE|nr:hypothetical protein BE21_01830 [Sorangium cellulosum]